MKNRTRRKTISHCIWLSHYTRAKKVRKWRYSQRAKKLQRDVILIAQLCSKQAKRLQGRREWMIYLILYHDFQRNLGKSLFDHLFIILSFKFNQKNETKLDSDSTINVTTVHIYINSCTTSLECSPPISLICTQ